MNVKKQLELHVEIDIIELIIYNLLEQLQSLKDAVLDS